METVHVKKGTKEEKKGKNHNYRSENSTSIFETAPK